MAYSLTNTLANLKRRFGINRHNYRLHQDASFGSDVGQSMPLKFVPPYEYEDDIAYIALQGKSSEPYITCPENSEIEALPLPLWGQAAVTLGLATKAEILQAQWNWVDIVMQGRRTYVGIDARCETNENGQVYITEVPPNTPASKGGLEVGDIILEVNKESVVGMERKDICNLVHGDEAGSSVSMTVLRDNKPVTLTFQREVVQADHEADLGQNREAWVELYKRKQQELGVSVTPGIKRALPGQKLG